MPWAMYSGPFPGNHKGRGGGEGREGGRGKERAGRGGGEKEAGGRGEGRGEGRVREGGRKKISECAPGPYPAWLSPCPPPGKGKPDAQGVDGRSGAPSPPFPRPQLPAQARACPHLTLTWMAGQEGASAAGGGAGVGGRAPRRRVRAGHPSPPPSLCAHPAWQPSDPPTPGPPATHSPPSQWRGACHHLPAPEAARGGRRAGSAGAGVE